ncbi:GNAT family N-acetyltransferase [Pseudohalioglobus sediminis]|uniref:GNAT family N-acetyltransferase n=1 Tax=Pseudohalioglobus sediminis TaxID=2606449 RepID=A0A5B0WUX5_9GAMM|nr:GNAT family N-acetyltransferase [Pseudohalioglobus sediminis]KAA1190001.1 GNAT family N-acetyltransferase [Pseudohalioglobus sediminis]
MTLIRDTTDADFSRIVKLNTVEEQQTSPMSLQRLRLLDKYSSYNRVAEIEGEVVAFLLAIPAGVPYENENYDWFSRRFQSFLYIDRIVVAAEFSGRGVGSSLYADLFAFARSNNIGTITCEYNIKPLNPASRAFHGKFGFKEAGTQWVANATKQVSLQCAEA